MKIMHWAAAVGVSLATIASPAYAQYPLYGTGPTARSVNSPARAANAIGARPFSAPPFAGSPNVAQGAMVWSAPQTPGSPVQIAGPSTGPSGSQRMPYAQPYAQYGADGLVAPNVPANVGSLEAGSPSVGPDADQPFTISNVSQRGPTPPAPHTRSETRPLDPSHAMPPVVRPMPPTGPVNGNHAGASQHGAEHQHDQSVLPHAPHAEGNLDFDAVEYGGPAYYYHPPRGRRHHMRGLAPSHQYAPGFAPDWGTTIVEGDVAVDQTFGEQHPIGCTDACCAPPPCRSPWYGSYSSLVLTRDNENEVWLSYDTANIGSQILGTLDADLGWRFGGDVRIGKYLDEGCHSMELAYFGILPARQEANAYGADMAGNLDSSLAFDSLSYDPGGGATSVASMFNNAERHMLQRSYRAHNVEANLWRHCVDGSCGKADRRPARISWLIGFRYMNYSEGFHFWADPNDTVFGNQPDDELRYDSSINNHLFGLQLGGMGEFCLSDRWQFTSTVKAGVMANRMDLTSFIGSTQRAAFVDNVASPFNGQAWDVRTTKNDVSLLGELDLGLRYRWSEYWNLTSGYRAVGLSGVGLSTNQVPVLFADLGNVRQIDGNGSLILHGVAYFGAEYNY